MAADQKTESERIRGYFRRKIRTVTDKLNQLDPNSTVRKALDSVALNAISEDVEQQEAESLTMRRWPPLLIYIDRHCVSQIRALDADVELVRARACERNKQDAVQSLQEILQDRKFRADLFEVFVKAQMSKVDCLDLVYDAPLPNGRNADVMLRFADRQLYLECMVLSESDEDQKRQQKRIDERRYADVYCVNPEYEADRFYRAVYGKLALKWNPDQSQLSESEPNILLISVFGQDRSLWLDMLTQPLGELLPGSCAERDGVEQAAEERLRRCACSSYIREPLTQAGFDARKADLLALRSRIGVILVFKDLTLIETRANPHATHAVDGRDLATLSRLLSIPPIWWGDSPVERHPRQ